nr:MAG TPA: hypothetical protein [Caudoviricetes sp.]
MTGGRRALTLQPFPYATATYTRFQPRRGSPIKSLLWF